MAHSALLLFFSVLFFTTPVRSEEPCTTGECSAGKIAGLSLLQSPAARARTLQKVEVHAHESDAEEERSHPVVEALEDEIHEHHDENDQLELNPVEHDYPSDDDHLASLAEEDEHEEDEHEEDEDDEDEEHDEDDEHDEDEEEDEHDDEHADEDDENEGADLHAPPASSLAQVSRLPVQDDDITYVGSTKIPCLIHQTWKTNDMSKLEGYMRDSALSFRKKNPKCKHKIWSDVEVETFMKKHYKELAEEWPALKPVERADLFRYAVVHKMGGFYADIDVVSLRPFKDWQIPDDAELVVGYENGWHLTEDSRRHAGFTRNEQLEQWFFGAAPGHPALQKCLKLFQQKRQWGIEETIELTGPALFSDGVHEYFWSTIAKNARKSIAEAEVALRLQQRDKKEMKFPPGRGPEGSHVLILSANQVAAPGFSAGVVSDNTLIQHLFKGTWKATYNSSVL